MKKLSLIIIALLVAVVAPQMTFAQAPKAEKAEKTAKSSKKEKTVLKAWDKCINFSGQDVNGKTVTLKDLKGKYVFIDVWATWCGPCVAEIPYLRLLESKLHGKEIVFVSISLDKDKAKWIAMVNEAKLTGIQIHMADDSAFAEAFDIQTIPRFILLDKKGVILRTKMMRPSNQEEIYETLISLKGI